MGRKVEEVGITLGLKPVLSAVGTFFRDNFFVGPDDGWVERKIFSIK